MALNKTLITNLRGRDGLRGLRGVQGVPGAGGLTTDAAVSALITLPSQTKDALEAAIAKAALLDTVFGYDIVLCWGQSNMRGAGTRIVREGRDAVNDRIFAWGVEGPAGNSGANTHILKQAQEPIALFAADAGVAQTAPGVSMAIPFAREYLKTVPSNRRVLIVNAAYGGTAFSGADSHDGPLRWSIATTGAGGLYQNLLTEARLAIAAAGANSRIVAVLGHQGEQDASNGTSRAAYATHLANFAAAVRGELDIEHVPFVIGQMRPEWISGNAVIINEVHIDAPRNIERSGFAYAPVGTGGDPVTGDVHFNSTAQHLFGASYFEAFQRAKMNTLDSAPAAPTNVRIIKTTATDVVVQWDQARSRVVDYKLEKRIAKGAWTTVARNASLDTRESITEISTWPAQLSVRVSTINEEGTSVPSLVATLGEATFPGSALRHWYKIRDLTPLADGAEVASVPNSVSAVGGSLGAAAGQRPKYRSYAINGHPVLTFDGVDDMLDDLNVNINEAGFVVVIGRYLRLPPGSTAFAISSVPSASSSARRQLTALNVEGVTTFAATAPVSLSTGVKADTQFHAFGARFRGTGAGVRVDGTVVPGTLGTNTMAGLRIGGTSGGEGMPVEVAEVIVGNQEITDDEWDEIFAYAHDTFGTDQ